MLLWSIALAENPAPAEPVADGCPVEAAEIETPPDDRLEGEATIVVFKEARRLGLYRKGGRIGCWPVGLGSGYPAGHKQQRGDMRTPEGWYQTSDKPWSSFYAAIAVHYPEVADAQRGVAKKWITPAQRDAIVAALKEGKKPLQTTKLGGEILIHGGGGSTDWTLGCIALDDEHIDALRQDLPKGMRTSVLVLP